MSLTLPAGSVNGNTVCADITIVNSPSQFEKDETLTVHLVSERNVNFGLQWATIRIVDSDSKHERSAGHVLDKMSNCALLTYWR